MELDDVVVPVGNMLGKENQGFEIIMSSMSSRNIPNSSVYLTAIL